MATVVWQEDTTKGVFMVSSMHDAARDRVIVSLADELGGDMNVDIRELGLSLTSTDHDVFYAVNDVLANRNVCVPEDAYEIDRLVGRNSILVQPRVNLGRSIYSGTGPDVICTAVKISPFRRKMAKNCMLLEYVPFGMTGAFRKVSSLVRDFKNTHGRNCRFLFFYKTGVDLSVFPADDTSTMRGICTAIGDVTFVAVGPSSILTAYGLIEDRRACIITQYEGSKLFFRLYNNSVKNLFGDEIGFLRERVVQLLN